MLSPKIKYRFLGVLFFLAAQVLGCGKADLETQLIEENAQEKVSLPPEVMSAIEAGLDEVEVPVTTNEGGLSKPSEFSRVYYIDYAARSEPVHEAPKSPTDTTCGSSSASSIGKAKWTTFPILYSISTNNLTEGVDPAAAKAAVVNALNTWDQEERPAGNLFLEAGASVTPPLTVRWAPIDGKGKTLALASNTFNSRTKVIISSQLTFDTGDTWKIFPSLACKSQGSEFDIEGVGAHEVGHVLGVGHPPNGSKNKSLTLYAFTNPGETLKRTLDKGDRAGLAKRYPAKKK